MDNVKKKAAVAWRVDEIGTGHSVIVFHHHGLAARRQGANHFDGDFDSVECRRDAQFDQFSAQGFVPPIELLKAGWWYTCPHCGNEVRDDDDRDDEEATPIDQVAVDGENAYCNNSCLSAYKDRVRKHNAAFEKFKTDTQSCRPDFVFVEFTGLWPQLTFIGRFKFPGSKYLGSVRQEQDMAAPEWRVANGDLESWEKYLSTGIVGNA